MAEAIVRALEGDSGRLVIIAQEIHRMGYGTTADRLRQLQSVVWKPSAPS